MTWEEITPLLASLALIILAVINVAGGYRKGIVKSVVSLVSLVILCVMVILAAYGLRGYNAGNIFQVVLMVVLLIVLILVHNLLGLFFFSAKLMVKLPVLHAVDKILGALFGLFETVLILWTVYIFSMMMDLGKVNEFIASWTEQNPVLTLLYENNYLAMVIENVLNEFSFIPLEDILKKIS